MYEDQTLVCEDCGKEFVFSAGEQEFYAQKGLANTPKSSAKANSVLFIYCLCFLLLLFKFRLHPHAVRLNRLTLGICRAHYVRK